MSKINIKPFLRYQIAIILILLLSFEGIGQLSMFNKIDTVKGFNTKVLPLDFGFLVFNSPQFVLDSVKFRLSRFDECGNVDWVRDYSTLDIAANSMPIAIKESNTIYLLLQSPSFAGIKNQLTLVNINTSGDLNWARSFNTVDKNISSFSSNILFSQYSTSIYIISSDEDNNTVIFSLDRDGEIMDSKKINGMKHRSSLIDAEGNLVVFSQDSTYTKIRLDEEKIDTVIWSKHLEGWFFAQVNNPISILGIDEATIITAIVDTVLKQDTVNIDPALKQDTAIYRLVKLDNDGKIIAKTDGFYSPDYSIHPTSLKALSGDLSVPRAIYFMLKNKVLFFDSNLNKINSDPKIYKFAKDSFEVRDAALEVCSDVSLVMSGFCYKYDTFGIIDLNSPYMFVSKTQPESFVVEAEQPECLEDSTGQVDFNTGPTFFKPDTLYMDTVEITFSEPEFEFDFIMDLNEDKCGIVNMELKADTDTLCPGQETIFKVPSYKGATYKWDTGERTRSIVAHKQGVYTVTVTLCDTVQMADFVYKYTDDVDDCFSVLYPNAFFPTGRTDSLNSIFKTFQENEFNYDLFNMKIFDRWGEKVFETNDSEEGWNGTFRGKDMPPGVYLYSVHWEAILDEKKYEDTRPGQVILLR